jgi:hypothetical protein
MEIGSKQIEWILHPESVERVIHQYTRTPMSMLNLFEPQNNQGDKHFTYDYSKRNYETDVLSGILPEPVELTEGSEYPQVSFSGIQEEYGQMTRFGFEVQFTQESAKNPRNFAFFKNAIMDMGMVMTRMINRFAFYELNASAGLIDPITLGDGQWVSGNEAIDDDIVKMKRAMENQTNYENQFSPSDLFVSKTAYDSAEDLYKVINANGQFNGVANGMNINIAREINTGAIAIDRTANPAIWYYNLDDGDNRLNDPNNPMSSLINVHYFEDPDTAKNPRSFGYQLSVELGLAVNKEMAILTQAGV